MEDLRFALEDLGLSDAQIKLSIRGAPSYRGIWVPYKEWCCDHNRYVLSCVSFDSFNYGCAANQLAAFLADRSGTDHVGPVATLCNYRSCISKFFSVVFNVNLTDSSRVKAVIDGYGKDHPSQPRWNQDQTWDPGCIVAYWAKQPLNDALSTAELALKSWSLFAVACWPRCSDGARLVRSSIKFSENGEMHFRYKGTKNLKVPILGPQLGIPAEQADPNVCVARCMHAYLNRTAGFDHQDRVWCCTVKKNGAYPAVSTRGDTLRGWMRRIMTRCGVDPIFTGGSIRQAASSKAINDGWEPAAVLELGMWKSFAMWNRFYNRSRLSMAPGSTSLCSGL